MSADVERVAAVLAAHHLPFVPHAGQVRCPCGEWTGYGNEHALHVAQAIAAGARDVAAEAVEWPADDDDSWRAVAKRWECLYREAVGIPASEHQRRRLEQMADAVEEARARANRPTATGDQA